MRFRSLAFAASLFLGSGLLRFNFVVVVVVVVVDELLLDFFEAEFLELVVVVVLMLLMLRMFGDLEIDRSHRPIEGDGD